MTRVQAVQLLHERTAIYTRDPVVDALLDRLAWPAGDRKLLEPSCGDGAFLIPALLRLLEAEPDADADRLSDLLVGYEVHPGAAQEARGRVASTLLGHGWDPREAAALARRMVLTADFLTEGPADGSFPVVAGNPPYLRYAGIPEELRPGYAVAVPDFALGDLLHAFLERCARVLQPGGEIGFVTADRWLVNEGASILRKALGRRLAVHYLKRLDARSAFYRPKKRQAGTPPRVQPVALVLRPGLDNAWPLGEDPLFPDALGEKDSGPRLGDVAKIRLAPWLGREGIFVVDAAKAATLPPELLVPVVDSEELVGGVLGPLRRFAIRTRPDVEPPAPILDHLRATMGGMAPRGRRKTFWMPPESWHHWDLSQETLVVPRITKPFRAIRLPAGVLPINHGLSVVAGSPRQLDLLEAYLNSEEARAWVQARATHVENDFLDIRTGFLRNLPVPASIAEADAGRVPVPDDGDAAPGGNSHGKQPA